MVTRVSRKPPLREFQRAAEFRTALRAFLRRSETIAREHELTPQRYLLLLMVKGAPDGTEAASVSDLATRMQLSQSTVTELVARSEEAGLLERVTSLADGRVTIVRLTAGGDDRLTAAMAELGPERRRLTKALGTLP
jgi:DNA-binding MarR family transcriptional regulator